MQTNTNLIELTRQQHEAIHFRRSLESGSTFIERLETFLAEMDRRGSALSEVSAVPATPGGRHGSTPQSPCMVTVTAHA